MGKLNKFLNRDRKALYMILSIVMVLVLTLTVVYAALSTTLNINGNAEVTAASWDIHFDNIQINSGSLDVSTPPKITDSRTVNFIVDLQEPGDYYKFTVDIVNSGTIDAMIDSVVKMPELTIDQTKYIKYEIEYTDGNSINTKQLLPKDTAKTISVLVAYRSDIASSDIPIEGEILNLSFTLIYTQADSTGMEIPESTPLVRMVNGDLNTIGSEVAIGDEHFYIISSDDASVTMFAKYNLYVGNRCTSSSSCMSYGEEATGVQDPAMIGFPTDASYPRDGIISFSSTAYWTSIVSSYPAYVYDSHSNLYTSVENYKVYLENMDVIIEEARLITKDELVALGCSTSSYSCTTSYPWTYSTNYWTGSAFSSTSVWNVYIRGNFYGDPYSDGTHFGVRPVIKISKSEF